MTKINVFLVKKLRERTGAGIMDCKKVLAEVSGNIEMAIENMRKSGVIKAAKKSDDITSNGVIITKIDANYGCILEINCQTDFVAKGSSFRSFADKVANVAITSKVTDVEVLKMLFEEDRVALVTKTNENIKIRRVASLKGEVLGSYQHGARIGVLVAAKGDNKELIKQLAMHVAASKPVCVNLKDISTDLIQKEYQILLDIAMQSGKTKEIAEKIVEGRMKKFTNEVYLKGQQFVIDPSKSVAQLLKEHNADVTNFIRFELGERIENENIKNNSVLENAISKK